MTLFDKCNGFLLGILGTWSILLILTGACNLVLALKQRKKRFFLEALFILVPGSFFLQMVRNAEDNHASLEPLVILLDDRGWMKMLAGMAILMAMTMVAAWITHRNLLWNRMHVTPLSIQESFEALTVGVCYYRNGGQCILANARMNDISRKMTGHILLNGEEFANAIFSKGTEESTICTMKDGRVFSFLRREVPFEKGLVHEIVANDITEQFQTTRKLREDMERLKRFHAELNDYHNTLRDTIRREEILRAKMNIHDEMNRLLLTTKNAIFSGNEPEKQKALMAWKSNALLLCKESEDSGEDVSEDLIKDLNLMAESLGIQLRFHGDLGEMKEEALILFMLVTKEAMINAVKHASAEILDIFVGNDEKDWNIRYVNPIQELHDTIAIEEAGGLRNLRLRLEKVGGKLIIQCENQQFCLQIWIPQDGQRRMRHGVSSIDRRRSGDAEEAL